MNLRGSLPLLILHLLGQQPSHGYRLAREIQRQSGQQLNFAEGSLYPMLHNLEDQGLISASEDQDNGRTRICYRLTEAGRQALEAQRLEWRKFARVVNLILGEATQ